MNRILIATILAISVFIPLSILAQSQTESQSQNSKDHVITVSRGGEAYAKPDLGILVMTLRSSAPIAEEAVAENGRKAKAVEAALATLGFTPQGYKITSVTFGQAGGARYGPGQPEIVAYEASQFVYVFFEGADLTDVARLTEKSAAVIEALRKAGAVPGNIGGPRLPTVQGALITYTIKDSAPYEKQALKQAIARARDAAQDIALGTGVEIAGMRSVKSTFLYGNYGPRSGSTAFEGLSYRFYSTKSDEVEIGASATIDYDFKNPGTEVAPTNPAPVASEGTLKAAKAKLTEGELRLRRGEYDQAIAAFQEGLKLDPSSAELRHRLDVAIRACKTQNEVMNTNQTCGAH